MPKFVHIDHCLCRYGGHEFDYAVNVLEAAERFGFEVALATNRRFHEHALLPAHWPVYPVFPFTTYTRHCFWFGGHAHLPFGLSGQTLADGAGAAGDESPARRWARPFTALAGLTNLPRRRDRRRRIRGFASACTQLFTQIRLGPNDHVFFATASEFDLLGLACYFRDHAAPGVANWHLQFHFGLYGGCEVDEAARQQRRRRVSRQVHEALQHLPTGKVRLYNTTEQLTRQYNQLEVGRFRYLPYPVSPKLTLPDAGRGEPLWVICAGAVRRDKKIRGLKTIVERLRDDPQFDGKLRIAAQLPKRWVRRLDIPPAPAPPQRADVPFEALPHPLDRTAYHDLIQQADIGLFLHDSRRYLAQCSGVLHEMLAAGKPVIVPGGCWLSDQIAGPIEEQVRWMWRTLPTIDDLAEHDLVWQRRVAGRADPACGPPLSFFGKESWETQFTAPAGATRVVVGFQWVPQTAATTSYLRLQLDQFACGGGMVDRLKSILGPHGPGGSSMAMFPLEPPTVRARLRLRNAYAVGRVAIGGLHLRLLGDADRGGCPAGRVGLIAADPVQIPALLHDMLQHYAHYRASAEAFSRNWCQTHDPARTIEILTGGVAAGRAAAA